MAAASENDAKELLLAADDALREIEAILTKMRRYAEMAAGDNLSDGDRAFLQKELADLAGELDRVAGSAEHNGRKLLDGGAAEICVPFGWDNCVHYTDSQKLP